MYEESTKFERLHNAVFDAIVPFKVDSSWFSLLKDTIDRIQRLPRWEVVAPRTPAEDDEEGQGTGDVGASPDIIRNTRVRDFFKRL